MPAITKLLSGLPARTMDQTAFDAAYAQLMVDLPLWGGEVNAVAAAMNTIAAGGAFALAYQFDTATADGDPTPGKLRLSSTTQTTATVLRLDVLGQGNADYTALIDTFDASTSTVKGTIRLVKFADPTKWLVFDVTARAVVSGYRNLTVVPVASSGANPFEINDQLLLLFTRNGDMGPIGPVYNHSILQVRDERVAGGSGDAFSSSGTWIARQLNAVKKNTISGASLASNRVTLPAGTYEFVGSASAVGTNGHQARLYNVTDAAQMDVGTSEYSPAGTGVASRSLLAGAFTISATKVIELQHYSNNATSYTGPSAPTGSSVVLADLTFRKTA